MRDGEKKYNLLSRDRFRQGDIHCANRSSLQPAVNVLSPARVASHCWKYRNQHQREIY